ncbi:hypothetical protein PR202_gb23299 [Eleusine coracana subsp. coracana]|uniref:DUF4220 domain-containing protein n=1 Tax=Eleusine coracana subsp. coracana TaxID=191504 RepID=A0AAV5FFW4_ELECO|nr:hypothetical protein PR202_gb23299 [Eleusine coracana subsp. coracana]
MGLSSAVDWWEESQLRVLVLSSLIIQWLLFVSSISRRFAIPRWFRPIIWLAYLGSDAVAIYGLATLFNRHKNQDRGGSSILEVVWAPVFLIHLGGQDGITAYNMEDNELWTRHVVTAVSQITVAIYVFIKSWKQDGDKKLLQAAIVLFFIGTIKCLEKPWALKSASIHSLVSSSDRAQRRANRAAAGTDPLEDYVQKAKELVQNRYRHLTQAQEEAEVQQYIAQPSDLFVDLASPYSDRLLVLKSFLGRDEDEAYLSLQTGLCKVFSLLYTKMKSTFADIETLSHLNQLAREPKKREFMLVTMGWLIRTLRMVLPFAAIGLFHKSHRDSYNEADVKITYALFICGPLLEIYSVFSLSWVSILSRGFGIQYRIVSIWPAMVAQYSLIGFFTRNEKHCKTMHICSFFRCKDYLDQQWCMKSCRSACSITMLVLEHLESGWKHYIENTASYWKFNDQRGQGTLEYHQCNEDLGWSLKGPFDESVLRWHIATDICFYSSLSCPGHICTVAEDPTICSKYQETLFQKMIKMLFHSHQCGTLAECQAVRSRQISNYMVYLLFVKPEMLLPGSRPNLFKSANNELKDILEQNKRASMERGLKQIPRSIRNLLETVYGKLKGSLKPRPISVRKLVTAVLEKVKGILKRDNPQVEEERHMKTLLSLMSIEGQGKEGLIRDAWVLAQELQALGNEKEVWDVIQGVWVEMLCFSAGRCRGYLHAKALGTGGEFLSYVWLLMSHMGMETLTERLQREEIPVPVPVPGEGGNTSAAPSTSKSPTSVPAPPVPEDRTSAAAPSTSEVVVVVPTDAAAPSEVPSSTAPSISEIHAVPEDDMV